MSNFNIYDYLYSTFNKVEDVKNLKRNQIADEDGNVYLIPSTGATPAINLENIDPNYLFIYNWADKTVNMFLADDSDNNKNPKMKLLNDFVVEPKTFINNPISWFKTLYDNYKENN